MTYFITAHSQLGEVSRTQTNDALVADMVAAEYARRGLLVRRWTEG